MPWDMSGQATPKQKAATGAQRRRSHQVSQNARMDADALRNPGRPRTKITAAEEEGAVWAFMATDEGRLINHLLSRCGPTDQLRLARAYRAICRDVPGSHASWMQLLLELEILGASLRR